VRHRPDARIHYYVMPHWPGNTPRMWRRQFYGDIAHGMKIVNLFEFRPVQAAYTENHVSSPDMYLAVRTAFRELGLFEDIVQAGGVRDGVAGLWFSEAGDIWKDNEGSFAAAKRAMYIAIRHSQASLDVVVEEDALDGTLKDYRVLYLTDAHVSRQASAAIAKWVLDGGTLFATAGAGMWNELNRPNAVLRDLFGVEQVSLSDPEQGRVAYIKQDIPFAPDSDTVTWRSSAGEIRIAAVGATARVALKGAEAVASFVDGSPAVATRAAGKGSTIYCAFLPSLSYFKPAIPMRPVDRGSTDDAMSHFIPTAFSEAAGRLIALPLEGIELPVVCSQPLVETTVLESKQGMVVPMVNWSGSPVERLTVTVAGRLPTREVTLAGGSKVEMTRVDGKTVFTLDLDVADALILR